MQSPRVHWIQVSFRSLLFSAELPLVTQLIPLATAGLVQIPSKSQSSRSMHSCVEEGQVLERTSSDSAPACSLLGCSAGTAAPMEGSLAFLTEWTCSCCLLPFGRHKRERISYGPHCTVLVLTKWQWSSFLPFPSNDNCKHTFKNFMVPFKIIVSKIF